MEQVLVRDAKARALVSRWFSGGKIAPEGMIICLFWEKTLGMWWSDLHKEIGGENPAIASNTFIN